MAQWKVEELARIRGLSNADLLDEALAAQAPDDYDGCFTKRGEFEKDATEHELKRRLEGWINA